jgi:hypothetical protein
MDTSDLVFCREMLGCNSAEFPCSLTLEVDQFQAIFRSLSVIGRYLRKVKK